MTLKPIARPGQRRPIGLDQALYASSLRRATAQGPLQTRLEQLKKQHGWGDISDREYQTERELDPCRLAQLPDEDRIKTFDAYRAKLWRC